MNNNNNNTKKKKKKRNIDAYKQKANAIVRSVSVHGCIYMIFLLNIEKRRKIHQRDDEEREYKAKRGEKKTTATENNSNDTTTKHSLTYALTKTVLVRCTVCERRDTKYVSLEIHEKRFSFSSPVYFFFSNVRISFLYVLWANDLEGTDSVWKSHDKRSNCNSAIVLCGCFG